MILLEFLSFVVLLAGGSLALLRLDFARPFLRVVPVAATALVMAVGIWVALRLLRRRWQRSLVSWLKETLLLAAVVALPLLALHFAVPGFLPVLRHVYGGAGAVDSLRILAGGPTQSSARWAKVALGLRREALVPARPLEKPASVNGGELAPPSPDELDDGASAPETRAPGPIDEARTRLLYGLITALVFSFIVVVWAARVASRATKAAQRIFKRHQKLIEQIIPQTEAVEKAFFCSELRPSRGNERTPEIVPKELLGIWTARRLILLTDYRGSLRRPNLRQVPLREIEDVESRDRLFTFAGRAMTLFLRSGDQIVLHLWSSEMAREVELGLKEAIRKSISLTDPDWRPTDTTGEHVKGLCHSCFNGYNLPIFEPPDCPNCGARLGVRVKSRIASLLRFIFWVSALGAVLSWQFLIVDLEGCAVGKDREILLLAGSQVRRFDAKGGLLAVPATWPAKTPPSFVHADLRGRFYVGSPSWLGRMGAENYERVLQAAKGEHFLSMSSDRTGRYWLLFEKEDDGAMRPGVLRLDGNFKRLRGLHPLLGPAGETIGGAHGMVGIPGGFLLVTEDGRLLRYDGQGACQGSLYAGALPPVAGIELRGNTGLLVLALSRQSRLGVFGSGRDVLAHCDLKDPAIRRFEMPSAFLPAMAASLSPMGRIRPSLALPFGDDVLLVDGWAHRLSVLDGKDWKSTRLLSGAGLMDVLDAARVRARIFTALTGMALLLFFIRACLYFLIRGN